MLRLATAFRLGGRAAFCLFEEGAELWIAKLDLVLLLESVPARFVVSVLRADVAHGGHESFKVLVALLVLVGPCSVLGSQELEGLEVKVVYALKTNAVLEQTNEMLGKASLQGEHLALLVEVHFEVVEHVVQTQIEFENLGSSRTSRARRVRGLSNVRGHD